MSTEILVATIAAGPPTLAAILSYAASRRSLKRSIGDGPGLPLHDVLIHMEERFETRLDRFESKLDRVNEDQAEIRERLASVEAEVPRGRYRG